MASRIGTSKGRGRNRGRSNKRFTSAAPKAIAAPQEAQGRPSPESWGIDAQAIALASNADVEARHDPGGRIGRAQRRDVFAQLFYRPGASLAPTSYDAVRRFQEDLAILHRTQGASDAVRVTGAGQTGALAAITAGFSITRAQAGERIDAVLAGMRPWCAKLIREICEAEVVVGQSVDWKAIVRRFTNQKRPSQAGEMVRMAADDMAESYRRIDNEPKRAAG